MELSIIIVNYNVRYFLEQCLLSVYKAQQNFDIEVFVVDNNSVDDSVSMVQEKFPRVKLIANKKNVGFSKANNQAIHLSRGKYILLLNPDTVVEEKTFDLCYHFMENHLKVGALGVRMIDGAGNFLPESKRGLPSPEVALYKMMGLNKLFPKHPKFGKYHLGNIYEFETAEIEVLAGAFMFMRKSVLDEAGLLDETYFMYGEDIDLSYRITLAGYKNYYFPQTTIIHYKGESTKKLTANYVKTFYNAMIIFAEKHYHGKKQKLLTTFIKIAIKGRAFIAHIQRFFNLYWTLILDLILIWFCLLFIKDYWEEHIKYITKYPKELVQIHFPIYSFIWLLSLLASGVYSKQFSIKTLIKAILTGTLFILVFYSLLPESLRFSRGIIIFSTMLIILSMASFRLIWHYIKFGNLQMNNSGSEATVIVGTEKEAMRVFDLIKPYKAINFIGFAAVGQWNNSDQVLSSVHNLKEIKEIFKIDQFIFCQESMPASDIFSNMNSIGSKVKYKIAPQDSDFIIGSNSKNKPGNLFAEKIKINLAEDLVKRKKRFFDIIAALLSLLFFWVIPEFYKMKYAFINNSYSVLIGKKTWVGYFKQTPKLPILKDSVYGSNIDANLSPKHKETLDFLYTKNYQIKHDFDILLAHWFHLSH